MKYYILIILILSCTRFALQFVEDTKNQDKELITLFILIAHIVATVGYFNLFFISK